MIVAGSSSNAGQVKVFDALTLEMLAAFFPFGPEDRSGMSVAILSDRAVAPLPVPEPGAVALLGGLAAACVWRPQAGGGIP